MECPSFSPLGQVAFRLDDGIYVRLDDGIYVLLDDGIYVRL